MTESHGSSGEGSPGCQNTEKQLGYREIRWRQLFFRAKGGKMGIFANFDIINSFQYGVGSIDSAKKAQATTMKRLDAIDHAIGKRDHQKDSQSLYAIQQVVSMNKAIEGLRSTFTTQQVLAATVASQSDLNIETAESAATMQSTEEVNSTFSVSVDTDPAAEGSTAQISISGTYDGSDGDGELRFKVVDGGTHGGDRIEIKMYDSDDNAEKTVSINASDAIDKQYDLDNGLSLSLGEGDLLYGDELTVDVTAGPTSYSGPGNMTGSTATATITGEYDGSDGTGQLTFEVLTGGTHGEDRLRIRAYDTEGNSIKTFYVNAGDAMDKQYDLGNGLSLQLGTGDILKRDRFGVDVVEGDHSVGEVEAWAGGSAEFSLSGSYDGSNGTGELSFEVIRGGTHGENDLTVRAYDPEGNRIKTIAIDDKHALDREYDLGNGLSLSLGEGDILKGATFTASVVAPETSYESPSNWSSNDSRFAVSGEYDGSNGEGALSVKVLTGGTHGDDNLKLRVYDSEMNTVKTINVLATDEFDKEYDLGNGLSLRFGGGDFLKNTTFEIGFNEQTNNAIRADKAFNGGGADSANLEAGYSVNDGSFEVNGIEIAVSANDSVNSVLDRITQSAAGVTASYDVGSEKIILTQKTAGADETISFANDTSGFLSAMKLDSALVTPGDTTSGVDSILSEVSGLNSIQSGTLTINDIEIAIDTVTDSFSDVIDRINTSDAGVTATLSEDNSRLSLVGHNNYDFTVDSGDTNFFSAVDIAEGDHSPTVTESASTSYVGNAMAMISGAVEMVSSGKRTVSGSDAEEGPSADSEMMATMVNLTADGMNNLFDDSKFENKPNSTVRKVRNEIHSAISSAFGSDGPRFGTDSGVEMDFSEDRSKVMKIDNERIGHVISDREGAATMRTALFGNDNGDKGLLGALDEGLNKAMETLESSTGSKSGVYLDISA